jgi:hypothetical protein
MELPNSKKRLLEIALQYSSPEEFKAKNLSKYLLARKLLVLRKAFPPKVVVEPLKGVFKLYKGEVLLYVGHSVIDCDVAIKELADLGTIPFTHYTIYTILSDSDTILVALYLANKARPLHNTNIGKYDLTISMPEYCKVLSKPIRGTIKRK